MVVFPKSDLNATFRLFVAKEAEKGRIMGVDELLLLKHFLQYPEIDTLTATTLCQLSEPQTRKRLSDMETKGYHGGRGRGSYWSTHPDLYNRLIEGKHGYEHRQIYWEVTKTRVLSILMERAHRKDSGLSNKEIRQVTRFDRNQVYRLMGELQKENSNLQLTGLGRNARYQLRIAHLNAREH